MCHQVKTLTEKITTAIDIWIPGLNWHSFDSDYYSWFATLFSFWVRKYIKHWRQCFIGCLNISTFVKNTPLRVVFSTLFSLFRYPNKTLFLVFDILHELLGKLYPCLNDSAANLYREESRDIYKTPSRGELKNFAKTFFLSFCVVNSRF